MKHATIWPVWVTWTTAERIVFSATVSLKAGYGGNKGYRYEEAQLATGITSEQWRIARAGLIERGVFNAAGSVRAEHKRAYYASRCSVHPCVSQRSTWAAFDAIGEGAA